MTKSKALKWTGLGISAVGGALMSSKNPLAVALGALLTIGGTVLTDIGEGKKLTWKSELKSVGINLAISAGMAIGGYALGVAAKAAFAAKTAGTAAQAGATAVKEGVVVAEGASQASATAAKGGVTVAKGAVREGAEAGGSLARSSVSESAEIGVRSSFTGAAEKAPLATKTGSWWTRSTPSSFANVSGEETIQSASTVGKASVSETVEQSGKTSIVGVKSAISETAEQTVAKESLAVTQGYTSSLNVSGQNIWKNLTKLKPGSEEQLLLFQKLEQQMNILRAMPGPNKDVLDLSFILSQKSRFLRGGF